jgi:Tol biopolymer transport system component
VLRGAPQLWLPNVAAVTWLDKQRLLYSEIKTGFHMAVATSLESRAEHRDVYVPAHENGMAHKSYLSPDGKWVLIVEMDEKGAWQPCRLVPFDGLSKGRLVGPPGAPCTAGAWSPDGNWMYLNLSAGGDFHLWRQHVPNGKPEQLTSGPAGEEGIALASDGRSLITAVGVRQRPVWFHDRVAEQQVSIEGYEESPQLYSEARKVAYLRLDRFQNGPTPAEIWAADLDSGRNEPLLPGIRVTQFSISSEGRLVACALDAAGNTRLWLAELDRRSPPRQIGSVEPKQAYFGPKGVIYFLATEGAGQYVYEIAENGTGLRKVHTESIEEIHSVSPDGRWVSGYGAVPGQKGLDLELAYPTAGGEPVSICSPPCSARWARGGEYLYVSWAGGYQSHAAVGHTYVLPTRPGTMFPNLPPGGFRSEGELAAVPGVRVIAAADVGSGPSPDVYVFSRENVQRNLYRIPLP